MTINLLANASAERKPYPLASHALMHITPAKEARRVLSSWAGLHAGPTPLWNMQNLARHPKVGLARIKDESVCSPLGSFKALGAPIALVKLIAKRLAVEMNEEREK